MKKFTGVPAPQKIEDESFAIIDREVGNHDFDQLHWPIVRRIIHTTADFDFARLACFSSGSVQAGTEALRRGEKIFCDTTMVQAGVNKPRLATFGSEIRCHITDEDVVRRARREGITRSAIAVGKGVEEGCGIFLIGNAPTALVRLLDLAERNLVKPSLVVGVPVGFVGAEESKEALMLTELPFITCRGRKGGSAIAAAVLNALMILAEEA
jgi:precorrin-8X/cobalt-precorrin-8 methylmutase